MVLCFDTTGTIYLILQGMSTNITGSFYLSTLVIALGLMAIAAMFKIPLEFTAIILLPLHLALLACIGSDWMGLTGIILIYLGLVLAKNFFFKS